MVAITISNSIVISVSGISVCLQLVLSAPDSRYLRAPYSRMLEDDTCKLLVEEGTSLSRRLHSKGFSVQKSEAFHQHNTDDFEEDERNLLSWIGGAAYDDEITDFLEIAGENLIDDDDWLSPSKRPEDDAMLGIYDTGPGRTIDDKTAFVDAQNTNIANLIDDDDYWFSQLVPSNLIDDDDWFSQLEPPKGPEDDDMVRIFDTGSSLIIDDETTFMLKGGPSEIPVDDDDAQNSNVDDNSPSNEDNEGSGASTGSTGDDTDSGDTIDNTSTSVESGTDNISDSIELVEDSDGSLVSIDTENGVENTEYSSTSALAETADTRKQRCEDNMNGRWLIYTAEIKCDGLEAFEKSGGMCVSKSCSDDDASKFIPEIEKQVVESSSDLTDVSDETKCEYTFVSSGSPLLPGNMVLTTSALLLAWSLL